MAAIVAASSCASMALSGASSRRVRTIPEQSLGIHYNEGSGLLDYLVDPTVFAYRDGYVDLLRAPGLGIEVDEDAVARTADWGIAGATPSGTARTGPSPNGEGACLGHGGPRPGALACRPDIAHARL